MHLLDRQLSPPEEIVSIARQKGLDAICITDHDSMGLRERAEAYSREIGYPIFVGVEFFSRSGAISPHGDRRHPRPARQRTGLYRPGARKGRFLRLLPPLFAATIAGCASTCAMCTVLTARRSSTAARRLRRTGRHCASAASWGSRPSARATRTGRSRWGKYVTWLPETVTTLPDFVTALHTLETRPAIWTGSGYDVVTEF